MRQDDKATDVSRNQHLFPMLHAAAFPFGGSDSGSLPGGQD